MNGLDNFFISVIISIFSSVGSVNTSGAAEISVLEHATAQQCEAYVGTKYNHITNENENKGHVMTLKFNNTDIRKMHDRQTSACIPVVAPSEAGAIYTFGMVFQNNGYEDRIYRREAIHLKSADMCDQIDNTVQALNPEYMPVGLAIAGNCTVLPTE